MKGVTTNLDYNYSDIICLINILEYLKNNLHINDNKLTNIINKLNEFRNKHKESNIYCPDSIGKTPYTVKNIRIKDIIYIIPCAEEFREIKYMHFDKHNVSYRDCDKFGNITCSIKDYKKYSREKKDCCNYLELLKKMHIDSRFFIYIYVDKHNKNKLDLKKDCNIHEILLLLC